MLACTVHGPSRMTSCRNAHLRRFACLRCVQLIVVSCAAAEISDEPTPTVGRGQREREKERAWEPIRHSSSGWTGDNLDLDLDLDRWGPVVGRFVLCCAVLWVCGCALSHSAKTGLPTVLSQVFLSFPRMDERQPKPLR